MRSYGQFCALARALDIVGDRWTLLIIRELGIRPCRYRDLQDGLPGIATNLLADRLRALEDNGLVVTEEAPPPVSATLYRLTERGAELLPTLHSLGGWGEREMLRGQGDDAFRAHWLTMPVESFTGGIDPTDVAPLRVRLDTADPSDHPIDVVVEPDRHPHRAARDRDAGRRRHRGRRSDPANPPGRAHRRHRRKRR